jgi:hypothetical protein
MKRVPVGAEYCRADTVYIGTALKWIETKTEKNAFIATYKILLRKNQCFYLMTIAGFF